MPVDLEAMRKRADEEGEALEAELDDAENSNETEEERKARIKAADKKKAPFIFMSTANGTVKKTPLVAFSRQRSVGLIALELDEGDILISAAITDGEQEIMLFSDGGKVTRFKESDVRAMGRTARGVRGMRLPEGQKLISMLIPEEGSQILTASERGYGKRTAISEFPEYKRGGQGVIAMVSNERNGRLVGAVQVLDGEEIMLISDQGTLVRTRVGEVSSLGRNTQGVTLIKLASDEKLVGLERVQEPSLVEGEELEGEEVVDGLVAGVIDAGVEDAGEDLQADAAADDDEPQN
ncbi:DNA gyrase subunit A [Pseudomonas coronafaciens pv. coronafaciens]|nr:DNA gyrase subunit A [Pseudomonas coronafaciens pv. coronafaciens]